MGAHFGAHLGAHLGAHFGADTGAHFALHLGAHAAASAERLDIANVEATAIADKIERFFIFKTPLIELIKTSPITPMYYLLLLHTHTSF